MRKGGFYMSATKRLGSQTVELPSRPSITAGAAIVGKMEGEGPLREYFDQIIEDAHYGEKTWEKAESKILQETADRVIQKAGIAAKDIHYMFGGDLLNQCIATTFGVKNLDIPFYGLFGACSTMAQAISLAAMMVDGGYADHALATASSHFCSAERQFRFPLEYGGQRPPTSSWTVTGSGAMVISAEGNGPYITHVTTGKILDWNIKDANNMGAAMAPAAADTIIAHLQDTGRMPDYYDLILTGDLGMFGKQLCEDILRENNIELGDRYNDCGLLIFDRERQQVEAGGSGCGCAGVVFSSYVLKKLQDGAVKNVLLLATGALMSKVSSQQEDTIPGIAHAVAITTCKE
jgi:stage V sporulation protein AD